ncbi:glycine cleavage system aminomethyltransferase GcvT [Weeksella virosa]|uniref:glycine cleavage system aminomethyltransferase GcvT n=1 Tax=Weeksella virosa TaxID=1014 RepID=UPI0025564849|nr:glycine cleavage system aminomethyltransferase GcvT [Weeksella virosa]MDK7375055.1 glycine cleavage system aminomethyltransferase GcvT [Weeksella virosa]
MKKTALNQKHKDLGAKMVPYAGFEMPVQYSGVNQEHFAVREKVGVFDVSHMGQIFVKGEKSIDYLQHILSNDVSKIADGQAQYNAMTNEEGGIVDDLIIYRLAADHWMVVVNASNAGKDWDWMNKYNTFDVELVNESDNRSLLAIQGPKAIEAMQSLTDVDLSSIPFYHFVVGKFAGIDNVLISATGYTGSGGFEVYFSNEAADTIWEKVLEAGEDFGIIPCGLAARDTLRLEKGYCLYGNDINETTSPYEAGLGWVTKLDTNFIGSDALKKQKEQGVDRKLVAFKMLERGIPRQGYKVVDDNENTVGEVTSGTQSPMLKQGIGLAYVHIDFAKIGTTIRIKIRDKNILAEVVKAPFV